VVAKSVFYKMVWYDQILRARLQDWQVEVPGYSQGHEAKEGSKVVLGGGTSREQTLQQSNVISGIEDPNLKRQSKGYRDAEVIRPIGIRFRWRYF